MAQEPLLAGEPAAVAGEVAAGGDDAVAGDEDVDRVPPVRAADGADGPGIAHRRRLLSVRAGLAERDRAQRVPRAALELRAGGGDGDGEDPAFPVKILLQLSRERHEMPALA